jgi:hypothetical protein
MSASGLNINADRARFFKCQEMFRYARLPGAHG